MSAETDIQFEVWQDGFMVAAADDIPNAQHYMMMYGQDGPVEAKTAITTRFPGFNKVSAAASPVVPVGESREEIAKALFERHWSAVSASPKWPGEDDDDGSYWLWLADAIIAALRPTDTGRG